jgi:acyl-CoA synthetase (AMP-forming)/AMP-acid ligase II
MIGQTASTPIGARHGGSGAGLTQPLHRLIREMPDAVATVDQDRSLTWRALHDRVRRFAGRLVAAGLERGDRVALLAPNGALFLEALLGTMWAGGVFVPLNTRLGPGELIDLLNDCEPRFLIVDPIYGDRIAALGRSVPSLSGLWRAGGAAVDDEEALVRAEPLEDQRRCGDDLAAILYTGGTTGRSKGVMLSHRSMMASALNHVGAPGCAPGAVMLHTAPLFHVGALSGVFAAMLKRSRHVFVPAFEPESVMRCIETQGVTDVFLVPTMIQALLDHPSFASFDLRSVERILYGASPISPSLMDRTLAVMPKAGFIQAYGMTELSPIATLLLPSDHNAATYASGRIRSAGRAALLAEVRIADADGRERPVGDIGEILVRGEGVMLGYWKQPEETDRALRDGWMHTGDLGRMDAEGYVYVVDRLKDMIISGGENVYSAEVEAALASHPSVKACAVIGVPHPLWGESVHAVIVTQTPDQIDEVGLLDHCRQRIARFKCPRSFEFRDVLPLSPAGKVLKALLRQQFGDRASTICDER